jgi:hypothetical protein
MILRLKLKKKNSGKEEESTCQGYNLANDTTRKEIDTSSVGIVRKEKST